MSGQLRTPSLRDDLRLAIGYAARAGLLKNDPAFAALQAPELSVASDGQVPATFSTVLALNEISALISPITIADLQFGRDPFDSHNQARSRHIQAVLTVTALIVLLLIGYFMNSLRQEQDAIVVLKGVQELKLVEKLTALRKLAQFETPFNGPSTLYDEYHQRALEISNIRDRIQNSYMLAVVAEDIPLFPLERVFSRAIQPSDSASGNKNAPAAPQATSSGGAATVGNVASSSSGTKVESISVTQPSKSKNAQTTGSSEKLADASLTKLQVTDDVDIPGRAIDVCVVDEKGDIRLPEESLKFPIWMQKVMTDSLSDFCFQLKAATGSNSQAIINTNFTSFVEPYISTLKSKVSLRGEWFLPFFYGLLGAMVFVMRNVASVRTPAMAWLPIIMRIALGGVAGIIIGWFSSSTVMGVPSGIVSFSLPFAIAFLAGYGIDSVFSILDRAGRLVGQPATR